MKLSIQIVNPEKPGGFSSFLIGHEENLTKEDVIILGAKNGEQAAGILILRCYRNPLYIEYINVDPSTDIPEVMDSLLKKVLELKEMLQIESVTAFYMSGDKEYLYDAYLRNGFVVQKEDPCYSFCLGDVSYSPLASANLSTDNVLPVSRVPDYAVEQFSRSIGNRNTFNKSARERLNAMNQDLTFAILEDKKITGCILVSSCGDGLTINALFGNGSKDTIRLIQSALTKANELYPPETVIYIETLIDSAQNLVEKLIPPQKLTKESMYLFMHA